MYPGCEGGGKEEASPADNVHSVQKVARNSIVRSIRILQRYLLRFPFDVLALIGSVLVT